LTVPPKVISLRYHSAAGSEEAIVGVVTTFGFRHPQLVACVRIGVAAWLLILATRIDGHVPAGGGWTVFLVAAAVLNLSLAYQRPRAVASRRRLDGDARSGS
jgi:hypothetical protein